MPQVLRAEITSDNYRINNALDDILTLFNVKVKTDGVTIEEIKRAKDDMENLQLNWMDWIEHSPSFNNLKPKEIYLAHRMALNGEIHNLDGKPFMIFNRLDMSNSSRILQAYISNKRSSQRYQEAKRNLLKELEEPKEMTKEEKRRQEQVDNEYCEIIYEELKIKGYSDKVFFKFKSLRDEIGITVDQSKAIYEEELDRYLMSFRGKGGKKNLRQVFGKYIRAEDMELCWSDLIMNLKFNLDKPIPLVQANCQNRVVSDYLKSKTKEEIFTILKSNNDS